MRRAQLSSVLPRYVADAGLTLVENVIALTIAAISLTAIFSLNGQTLHLLKTANESVAAEQTMQDRMEAVRNSRWSDVINSGYVSGTVLATAGSTALEAPIERITITGWPAPTSGAAPTFQAVRQNGSAAVVAGGAASSGFASYDLVRVDVSVSWTGAQGRRSRTVATSTIWGEGSR